MKDDCTTNSHYLMHTFVFENVGRMHFLNLGVKGLNNNYYGSWMAQALHRVCGLEDAAEHVVVIDCCLQSQVSAEYP